MRLLFIIFSLKALNQLHLYIQSPLPPPPNTADLGTDEKAAVFGNRRYSESYITYKTLLEMGGGIGRGEAVLGGAVLGGGGGTTVVFNLYTFLNIIVQLDF